MIRATLLALIVAQASFAQAPSEGAKIFNDLCTACHTIGGGALAGPDLATVANRSHDDLAKALKRMEDNVGPLEAGQTEALIALLKSPDAKAQIAALGNPAPAVEISPEQKAASATTGRRLFYGERRFTNGGTPCFGCHAAGGRGGNLAVDLTDIRSKRGEAALVATAANPPFPLMRAIYGAHPVTTQEAWHLLAFLEESAQGPAMARPEPTTSRDGVAAGLTLVVLGGVALTLRSRRAGARSRMVHK
ncbi:MAG TPA: c-type cytochrome [Thermoanaerobaculia bacterium]|nr:c-type cytochrome [Thermoanaerobaculia bacterium]